MRTTCGLAGNTNWLSYLVGGFNNLETYESQWEGLSKYIMENTKCLKPPTRYGFIILFEPNDIDPIVQGYFLSVDIII